MPNNVELKYHLCPVRPLLSVSSVSPAVEKEVDISSVSILPRRLDELPRGCVSPPRSDSKNDNRISLAELSCVNTVQ